METESTRPFDDQLSLTRHARQSLLIPPVGSVPNKKTIPGEPDNLFALLQSRRKASRNTVRERHAENRRF